MSDKVIIIKKNNGQIRIEGEVEIIDEEGRVLATKCVCNFCSCGKTQDPLFCDGSHNKA